MFNPLHAFPLHFIAKVKVIIVSVGVRGVHIFRFITFLLAKVITFHELTKRIFNLFRIRGLLQPF